MEDCSRCRVQESAAIATLESTLLRQTFTEVLLATVQALHALWPADLDEVLFARFFGVEVEQEGHDCLLRVPPLHAQSISVLAMFAASTR